MARELEIKLQRLLLDHKMTYQELSKLTGLSTRSISDMVNNKQERILKEAICKIADVFELDDIREVIDFKNKKTDSHFKQFKTYIELEAKKPNNFKGVLNINNGIIAIDDGGSTTGVVTKNHHEIFPSVKGVYGDRNLTKAAGKYDYIVEYKGEKYVMGTLAKYDCALPLEMHTKSKQNLFFDLSILVSIHQFGYLSNYLITSVPIKMHNTDEKNGRIKRLKGSHTIKVNGVTKTFAITDVSVAPETAVAFWINQPEGKTRYIDLGSRTIGWATTINDNGENRFIDTESGTYFGKGLEALNESYDPKALADYICGRLISIWNRNDIVYLLGGGALDEELVKYIREYFPKAIVTDNPQMINAEAMYRLGCYKYDMD